MAQYEEIKKVQRLILNPNVTEYEGRTLPTPQTSGTATQIGNYAFTQAEKFLST